MIPFAPFEPDKAPYSTSASDQMINALPAADGYKPMPTLVEISHALDDDCLGAVSVSNNGAFILVAGTRNKLFRLDTSITPNGWIDVSREGGYQLTQGDRWSFAVFGGHLVASQLSATPQSIKIQSVDNFQDIQGAPRARCVWVSGDFLVFGHLDNRPNAIQWSGVNDMNHWIPGRRGSDIQMFPDGGQVMCGFGGQSGSIIMQQDKIRYMNFSPQSSYTFTFSQANSNRGILAPNSLVNIGPGRFLYLCKDGFFEGIQGNPIGATRIDEWFFSQIDENYLSQVHAIVDPFEKIAWWIYRNNADEYRMIGYNWQLDRWCHSDQDVRDAVSLMTPDTTWDGLGDSGEGIDRYGVSFDARVFYGGSPQLDGHTLSETRVDSYPASFDEGNLRINEPYLQPGLDGANRTDDFEAPFDSEKFIGGIPIFAGFNSSNKLGFMNGLSSKAVLETASIELTQGGRSFVTGATVISDAHIGNTQEYSGLGVSVGAADHYGGAIAYKPNSAPSSRTGRISMRSSGRLHRFKVTIDAGTHWTAASAITPEFVPEGYQ